MRSLTDKEAASVVPQHGHEPSEEIRAVAALEVEESIALPLGSIETSTMRIRVHTYAKRYQKKFATKHVGDELFVKRTA